MLLASLNSKPDLAKFEFYQSQIIKNNQKMKEMLNYSLSSYNYNEGRVLNKFSYHKRETMKMFRTTPGSKLALIIVRIIMTGQFWYLIFIEE